MKDAWLALGAKLETVEPARLTAGQRAALKRLGRRPYEADARLVLPLVVARFKPRIEELLLAVAEKGEIDRGEGYGGKSLRAVLPTLYAGVQKDLEQVARALLGPVACRRLFIAARRFKKARTPALHPDPDEKRRSPFMFLARLGALPFEAVTHETAPEPIVPAPGPRPLAGLAVPELVAQARLLGGEKARRTLRRRGLLKPMPLGAVALLANAGAIPGGGGRWIAGTLHCSSAVPAGKVLPSVMVRMLLEPGRPA